MAALLERHQGRSGMSGSQRGSNGGNGAGLDVVTGGAGFIGSHLVDRLVAEGRRVRVIDNFASGQRRNLAGHAGNAKVELRELDIRDRGAVREAVSGAARVFHLAALADIVPSVQRPDDYHDVNAGGTFNVLEAARAAGVERLVYAASSSCYGIPDRYPTPEDAPMRPQYPYALTKYLGEEMVLHWGQVYGLPVVSLRLFNVYGPRARTSGAYGAVFGVFLAQMLADKPLTIVGDGEQSRDFTYVGDVTSALSAAAAAQATGAVFNVGSGRAVSVNRLVELLGATERVPIPKRPGEPDRTLADITRIRRALGWEPEVAIERGVAIMLEDIDYWREAPVWTADTIALATKAWFEHLSAA
jgi:UDP-glucose 4-epimerase